MNFLHQFWLLAHLCLFLSTQVVLHNDIPRVDTDNNIIDCHSGNIIQVNHTYYMYGEHYGNSTGFGPSPPLLYPKIVVYTSPDMTNWTYQGFVLSEWPNQPYGTFFTPWTVYNKATQKFVMWFNAYLGGCCNGAFGVAYSDNGINFTLSSVNETGKYAQVDGNSLFVDDDGTGYICYTVMDPGDGTNHRVTIEKLTSDYLHSTGENYGLFPESYVEGAILFKRQNLYYVTYGSCCCFCRGGSGLVSYIATSLQGPWKRQSADLNCAQPDPMNPIPICGAYGDRVVGDVIIQAQGIGLSILETVDNDFAYIWQGERWLSAANNNASCPDECQTCVEPDSYIKGNGYVYWYSLEFDDNTGEIQPLGDFLDSFTLDLAF